MTREEAIYELQLCVDAWDKWMLPGCSSLDKHKEAIKMALAALRGPTREQVEKIWKSEWVYSSCEWNLPKCPKCGCNSKDATYGHKNNFCPRCGAAMTNTAMAFMMQRLEALKDGTTD